MVVLTGMIGEVGGGEGGELWLAYKMNQKFKIQKGRMTPPHRLTYLNACYQGVGLWKHGLVERRVSIKLGFEISKAQDSSTVCLFLLPLEQDVELLAASAAPCLPSCLHAPCRHDKGLDL